VVDRLHPGDRPDDGDRLGGEEDAVVGRPVPGVAEVVLETLAAVGEDPQAPVRRLAADAQHADRQLRLEPRVADEQRGALGAEQPGHRRVAGEQRRRGQPRIVAPGHVVQEVEGHAQHGPLAVPDQRLEPQALRHIAQRLRPLVLVRLARVQLVAHDVRARPVVPVELVAQAVTLVAVVRGLFRRLVRVPVAVLRGPIAVLPASPSSSPSSSSGGVISVRSPVSTVQSGRTASSSAATAAEASDESRSAVSAVTMRMACTSGRRPPSAVRAWRARPAG